MLAGAEKGEPSRTAGETPNASWFRRSAEQGGGSSSDKKQNYPLIQQIPFLGMCPKETKSGYGKGAHSPTFAAAHDLGVHPRAGDQGRHGVYAHAAEFVCPRGGRCCPASLPCGLRQTAGLTAQLLFVRGSKTLEKAVSSFPTASSSHFDPLVNLRGFLPYIYCPLSSLLWSLREDRITDTIGAGAPCWLLL